MRVGTPTEYFNSLYEKYSEKLVMDNIFRRLYPADNYELDIEDVEDYMLHHNSVFKSDKYKKCRGDISAYLIGLFKQYDRDKIINDILS